MASIFHRQTVTRRPVHLTRHKLSGENGSSPSNLIRIRVKNPDLAATPDQNTHSQFMIAEIGM